MGQVFASCQPSNQSVTLHIYDVSSSRVIERANKIFRSLGTGAFHAAIEAFGWEWSFGFCREGTGVFCCEPKNCDLHRYRESVSLGPTRLTREEFYGIIAKFARRWRGRTYNLLHRNCCHFCDELAAELEVEPLPDWVKNLAGAGATISHGLKEAVRQGSSQVDKVKTTSAIISAAKEGRIDEKYREDQNTIDASAWAMLESMGEVDDKYSIARTSSALSDAVQTSMLQLFPNLGECSYCAGRGQKKSQLKLEDGDAATVSTP